MARKPKHEEHENHERWLVSYADFITLLFAFFVVMYSISSVNEGKYRVLSSSLFTAFNDPVKSLEPIQYGTPLKAPIIQHESMVKDDAVSRVGVDYQIMPSPKELTEMQKVADEIERKLKPLIDEDLVSVNRTNLGIEIEIKSSILFGSGSALLESKAIAILNDIAQILSVGKNEINVEGFTDNVPIKTLIYPSNWELSAARAASVVRLFTDNNIEPTRLKAIGFGEYRPIGSNQTAEGRNKNRRVTIVVLNNPEHKRTKLFNNEKKIKLEPKLIDDSSSKDSSSKDESIKQKIGTITLTPINKNTLEEQSPVIIKNSIQPLPNVLLQPKLITIGKDGVNE